LDPNGNEMYFDTDPINWDTSTYDVWRAISEQCMNLRDRIRVFNHAKFDSKSIGRSFYIDFHGYNEDPGQFEIIDDEETPLLGTNPGEITYEHSTHIEYGKNLMF